MIEPAPRAYERLVASVLEAEGYATQLGSYVGDGGIDIIATRGDERLAVAVGGRPLTVRLAAEDRA